MKLAELLADLRKINDITDNEVNQIMGGLSFIASTEHEVNADTLADCVAAFAASGLDEDELCALLVEVFSPFRTIAKTRSLS